MGTCVLPRPRLGALLAGVALVGALGLHWSIPSEAGETCDAGDARATCVEGNATTCTGGQNPANLPSSFTLFSNPPNTNGNNADANISGATSGGGTLLNLTILNPNVQIVGIVVKGGNDYNLYTSNVSNMHAPLVGGPGNIPVISHWFVCYNLGGGGNGGGPGDPGTPGAPGSTPGQPAQAVTGTPRFTG